MCEQTVVVYLEAFEGLSHGLGAEVANDHHAVLVSVSAWVSVRVSAVGWVSVRFSARVRTSAKCAIGATIGLEPRAHVTTIVLVWWWKG